MAEIPQADGWKLQGGNARMMERRPRPSIRSFLLSQASDPILAMACEPPKTNLRPFSFPKKRHR